MEQTLFRQLNTWRAFTLKTLQKVEENQVDQIPEGFNNNIRWNAGHIVVIHDRLTAQMLGEAPSYPKGYDTYFNKGTSPKDWDDAVPSLEEIKAELEGQIAKLEQKLTGNLDREPLGNVFDMPTVGDLTVFSVGHEAMHLSTIHKLMKFTKV
ncbi:DinB family protein [Alkalihalophilus pseudofirmus]|uniref:DinB family protein n=1 Tax=Alkalihalophilus pseudofirmus TaxID=79885 RepID=UPI00259B4172|nr:DinB family protein [Alkalihalophilus pseudofirmus]WEG16878.1 DinB family protein [Alkalihalophilus pseudofirmus]